MIGHYKIYSDANTVNKLNDKILKLLSSCKNTLKETIKLEDYEEEGIITVAALKEAFETMDIDLDDDMLDYILYVMYQKSESLSKLKYQPLFDLMDGKLTQG